MSHMPHKTPKTFAPQTTTAWAPSDAPSPQLVLPSTWSDKLRIQGHHETLASRSLPFPIAEINLLPKFISNEWWYDQLPVPGSGRHHCGSQLSLQEPGSLPIFGFTTISQASPDLTLTPLQPPHVPSILDWFWPLVPRHSFCLTWRPSQNSFNSYSCIKAQTVSHLQTCIKCVPLGIQTIIESSRKSVSLDLGDQRNLPIRSGWRV